MASYQRRASKLDEDGRQVLLLRNVADHSWFVGRPGDRSLDPAPLGGFISKEAARRWADAQFPGGAWHRDRAPRLHV